MAALVIWQVTGRLTKKSRSWFPNQCSASPCITDFSMAPSHRQSAVGRNLLCAWKKNKQKTPFKSSSLAPSSHVLAQACVSSRCFVFSLMASLSAVFSLMAHPSKTWWNSCCLVWAVQTVDLCWDVLIIWRTRQKRWCHCFWRHRWGSDQWASNTHHLLVLLAVLPSAASTRVSAVQP